MNERIAALISKYEQQLNGLKALKAPKDILYNNGLIYGQIEALEAILRDLRQLLSGEEK